MTAIDHSDDRPQWRRPLYSEDAEQAVLGACLMTRAALVKARAIVRADDFYRVAHQHVFDALAAMHDADTPADPLTLAEHLESLHLLDAAGGKEYIAYLIDAVVIIDNVEYHARIVHDRAQARRLVQQCEETAAAVRDGTAPVDAAQHLAGALLPVATAGITSDFRSSREIAYETLEAIETKMQGTGIPALRTGYAEIDHALAGGFDAGELIFLCAAPGGCKTALALNIATNVAVDDRIGAAVVSAEMGRKANMQRLLSRISHVPAMKIREASALRDDDFQSLVRAAGVIGKAPLWIDDTPRPVMRQIEAKCRRLKAQHPDLRLIVVDFIQLLERDQRAAGKAEENRALELTKIAYDLKHLAKELDAAVIATAQVDASSVEKRSDKRPLLSDIRWSQGIREAADFVGLLYRARAYDPQVYEDTLEIRFDKARDLEPFTATLLWRGATMTVASRGRAHMAVAA